jgi:starch phosphorylase
MAARFPNSVVFIPNYDMEIARLLVSGCDVWLNNPQRPLEASGTSGIKAAMNGVLNLSILDGWWPEGCWHGSTGWQIGGGYEGPGQHQHDLVSLYDVLMNEVMPTFYKDRPKWISMMRESIEMACTRFSSDRMLMEYHNLLYLPAATQKRVALSRV